MESSATRCVAGFRDRARATVGVLGVFLLLGVAGCRKFEYAKVEGHVLLDGKPLSGVKVVFYPDSEGPEQLPFAMGTTDEAGRYTLTLASGKPGALVGKNRVVVNWPSQGRGSDSTNRPLIPLRYTVAMDTPLIKEVQAGGGLQTIDLILE